MSTSVDIIPVASNIAASSTTVVTYTLCEDSECGVTSSVHSILPAN